MGYDLHHVQQVMRLLSMHGVVTWLFGGWAEELHGMIAPRAHRDVDPLYRSDSFAAVDRFLRSGEVPEIAAKRFPHKRAFIAHGVMTEIILVDPDCSTTFWGERRFEWPGDTFGPRIHGISVALRAALIRYRQAHDSLRRS